MVAAEAAQKLAFGSTSAKTIDANLNIGGPSNAADRGADIRAYGKELDSLRAKYNPLFAASQSYRASLTEINQAAKVGALTEKERAEAIMNTKVAFVEQVNGLRGVRDASNTSATATDKFAASTGLARHELINLSRQAQDVAVSLGSGQSFGTVLLQQGSQISDVFASSQGTVRGFFSQMVSGAASVLTPLRLVGGGVLALGAGAVYAAASWSSAQKDIERALIGVGQRSGATVADINKIASASASATGLSVSEATKIATEFARTGDISVNSIKQLTDATQGYSILVGKDAVDASKDLAKLMGGDLVGAAQQLNQVYGTIDGKTLEYVRTLQNLGDRQKAIQVIMDNIAPTNQRAVESLSLLEKGYDSLANAIDRVKNSAGRSLLPPPVPLQTQRDDLQAKRDSIANNPGNAVQQFVGGVINGLTGGDTKSAYLTQIDEQIKILDASLAKLAANQADLTFIKFAAAADGATKAIIPQISQIQDLERELGKLQQANANPEITGRQGFADQNNAAVTAIQNQLQALKESQAEAERYNLRVMEISKSWGDVGQSTALVLQKASNQLLVAEAIAKAEKLAAENAVPITARVSDVPTATANVVKLDQYRKTKAANVSGSCAPAA